MSPPRKSVPRRGRRSAGPFRASFPREVTSGYQKPEPITVRVQAVKASRSRVRIYATAALANYPFREENLRAMRDSVRALLPHEFRKAAVELYTDGREASELIPLACRNATQLRKAVDKKKIVLFTNRSGRPLVTRLSAPETPGRGLSGRHIALWQSHGRYFDQTENRWKWQRSALWQTCEDLYTQSYVLAVPGSDARKRRGMRAAAARTRRAEIRSAGRQRRRRAVCGGGGVGERRRGLRAPPAGLSYGRKSLPRRHDAPCADRDRRGHGPCRVAGRHSRTGRICGLCELRIDARKRRRRALYGPPPRRRDFVCRQSDDGRRDVDLPRAFSLRRRTAGGRDPFEPFAGGRAHRLGRRGEDRRRLRQRGPHVLRLAAPARRGACRGDQRLSRVSARGRATGFSGRDFRKRSIRRKTTPTTTRTTTCRAPIGSMP